VEFCSRTGRHLSANLLQILLFWRWISIWTFGGSGGRLISGHGLNKGTTRERLALDSMISRRNISRSGGSGGSGGLEILRRRSLLGVIRGAKKTRGHGPGGGAIVRWSGTSEGAGIVVGMPRGPCGGMDDFGEGEEGIWPQPRGGRGEVVGGGSDQTSVFQFNLNQSWTWTKKGAEDGETGLPGASNSESGYQGVQTISERSENVN